MVSFGSAARSFGIGFFSAANVQFDEKRKALAAKDAEFAKLATKTFAEFPAVNSKAARAKADEKNSLAIADQLGLTGVTRAGLSGGFVDPKKAFEFDRSTQEQFGETGFAPGQEQKLSVRELMRSKGIPDANIEQFAKERNIDLDAPQFQGQAARAPEVTGLPEGFTIQQALESPAELRVKNLAGVYVKNSNMFASNADFNQAKQAFTRGDFETVIDLSARSTNLQNNIFLPIIEQVLNQGIGSLSQNQRVVLDLYKPRDPLDQMISMIMLQNIDQFKKVIEDAIKEGVVSTPPSPDATDEENLNWWEENAGAMFQKAKDIFNELIINK